MFGMPLPVAVFVFVVGFLVLELVVAIGVGRLLRDASRHYRPRSW